MSRSAEWDVGAGFDNSWALLNCQHMIQAARRPRQGCSAGNQSLKLRLRDYAASSQRRTVGLGGAVL